MENIWLEVMAYGQSTARSVRHDRDKTGSNETLRLNDNTALARLVL